MLTGLTDTSVFRGHPEMLVFVDETGADRRDCMRRFGYSLRGRPAISHKLLVRGPQVSAIAAMSCDRVLDLCTVKGSLDAGYFRQCFSTPCTRNSWTFNQKERWSLVWFLPPYIPDVMPIEEQLFSKIKSVLKYNEDILQEMDIENALLAAFCTVTPDNCDLSWGYV